MFITYLRRELRRRTRQAVFIALGLALGIGLVITVTAASAGVSNAQSQVLHSLYGVGTDITVTRAPTFGAGDGGPFGFRAGGTARRAAGTRIHIDALRNRGLGAIAASSVATVSRLPGVAAAAGALTLTDTKLTGTIPNFGSGSGGFGGGGSGAAGSGSGASGARGSITPTSFGVAGVDLARGGLGPLSSGRLTAGRTFTTADVTANMAVVDSSYATQQKLHTGSRVTIAGTSFTVIGVVQEAQSTNPPDFYIPLARAQALSGNKGKVNTIYVSAASATGVSAVSAEISRALPETTVTTSASLASQVSGSLASAASLARNLGRWLAIAVLAAAFGLASLLTMAAVGRRVREFGTLKALGWRSRRIIGQVMGEALVTGLIGGAAGVALGYAGAALVSSLAPPLTASLGSATGSAAPGGARAFGGFPAGGPGGGFGGAPGGGSAGRFGRLAADAAQTVAVHLSAPVTLAAVALAVLLALAGGLLAGLLGGWRAARLRPAAALARVE
ncbi:MAG: ABC transporter permease [Gemmatimonadota bacterium]